MSGRWLTILVVVTLSSLVNSRFDLDSTIGLARCRASCLYKMQFSRLTDLECDKSFNCSQCWRACVEVKAGRSLCGEADCGPELLEACRFYKLSSNDVSPVPIEEVLFLNNSRVTWPSMSGPAVYVVMADGSQFRQTLESSTTLHSVVDPTTVRVLVVDWRGLVKVLSPVAESPVDQALYILHSLGMADNLDLRMGTNSQYDDLFSTVTSKVMFHRVWRLKVESVHYRMPLVLGKISWRHYHRQLLRRNQLTSYLVTWSEDGGVLKGNILTNTSSVTLSLLPDTLYRIKVSLVNLRPRKQHSELLVLDTHYVNSKTSNLSNVWKEFGVQESRAVIHLQQYDRFEVTFALVLLLFGVIVASVWRWQHRHSSLERKLLDERFYYPELFRGRNVAFQAT